MKVAVVGVGKVGLCLALVLCKNGYKVKGIDTNPETIERIVNREKFEETNVNRYLEEYGENLEVSLDASIVSDCDVFFIGVQTPSTKRGDFSLAYIKEAIKSIEPHFTDRKNKVVTVVSTVNPLDMEEKIKPLLGENVGLCYNPALIAQGKIIHDFEHPPVVMIGESDTSSGETVAEIWKKLTKDNTPIFRTSLTNIEIAKIGINFYLTSKISFLNNLTELCERVEGDIDIVTDIMKADQRIGGKKLFKGGLGFGGPCFPRDTICFGVTCRKHGVPPHMPQAVNSINMRQIERSVELLESFGKKRIAFLGLTYKENTTLIDESQSLRIARELAHKGYEIWAFDPKGKRRAMKVLNRENVIFCSSLHQCVSKGEVVFIGVPWADFYRLESKDFLPEQIVVDPWRILKNKKLDLKYVPYGLARTQVDTYKTAQEKAIREIGTMNRYVVILEALFYSGPQKLRQISYRTNITVNELKKYIDFLIRQQLIEEHVESNRNVAFAITQFGITVMKKFHGLKTKPPTMKENEKMQPQEIMHDYSKTRS